MKLFEKCKQMLYGKKLPKNKPVESIPSIKEEAPKPNLKRFNTMTPDRMVLLREITDEEYHALPGVETIVGDMLMTVPLGFRFKAEDGHVCEVVKGEEMFQHQWASLCIPERGLRHYNPVLRQPLFATRRNG